MRFQLSIAFLLAAGCDPPPRAATATAQNARRWHQEVMGSTCEPICGFGAAAYWDGRHTCLCQRENMGPWTGASGHSSAAAVDLCSMVP